MKKIKLYSEPVYFFAIILLAFSVAMCATTDFGLSMIVSPAFILSQKLGFITFGQGEYIIQAILFIAFCILVKNFKPVYLSSFLTGIIYGAVLDLWRLLPIFNPSVNEPGSMNIVIRIIFFAMSTVMCSLSIALFFHVYLYPQVYDFFVKGVSAHFGINRTKFKRIFDASCLAVSCIMTLLFFGRFVGVGVGTIVITLVNGIIIGAFDKLLGKHFEFVPIFPEFAKKFEID